MCVCGKSSSSNLQFESTGLLHSCFCSWQFCVLGPGSLDASMLRKLCVDWGAWDFSSEPATFRCGGFSLTSFVFTSREQVPSKGLCVSWRLCGSRNREVWALECDSGVPGLPSLTGVRGHSNYFPTDGGITKYQVLYFPFIAWLILPSIL